jgi:hypothetical protein
MNFPICYFCPTVGLTFKEPEYGQDYYITYKCNRCETEFFYDPKHPNVLASWSFNVVYRKQRFWIDWYSHTNCIEIAFSRIESEGQASGIKPLIKLPEQTSITPFNILQKLPTILTFL